MNLRPGIDFFCGVGQFSGKSPARDVLEYRQMGASVRENKTEFISIYKNKFVNNMKNTRFNEQLKGKAGCMP